MPSQRNVGWAQLKVGIMAVAAFVLLGILIFLITGSGSFWETKVLLYTYLSDSAALATGANVRLNGIYVGSIKNISFSNDANADRAVRVTMEIQESFLNRIPLDSQAAITSENALGGKYINITRGKDPKPVTAGATLPALDTSTFDDVVAQGYSVLSSTREMLKRIDGIVGLVEQGKGSIGKLLVDETLYNNLNGTVAETRKITEAVTKGNGAIAKLLNDDTLVTEMQGTIVDTRAGIARINKLIDGLEQGQGTAGKFLKDDALYQEVRQTNGEIKKLLADLNAGKGTAGKLLKDDALHNQLQAAIAKMDTLLGRINAGEGTLGQLAVNPQMYESLNGLSGEMHGLMKDFRANPKKFLSIKLGLF
jgi:phospholipid/cholesterol/gamma-HCH transport system substrate-binding protein